MGIGFNLVREWYGRVGKSVGGMTIQEEVTSTLLAVPFTNVRGWSRLFMNVREWTWFVGGTEQCDSANHLSVFSHLLQFLLFISLASQELS